MYIFPKCILLIVCFSLFEYRLRLQYLVVFGWQIQLITVVHSCANPDEYFFVDLSHFTSRAHGLIADAVRSFIVDSYEAYPENSAISSISKLNFCATFIFFFLVNFFLLSSIISAIWWEIKRWMNNCNIYFSIKFASNHSLTQLNLIFFMGI